MTSKHSIRRWIPILVFAVTSAGLLLFQLGASIALILLFVSVVLIWLALIPEFFDFAAIQKRQYGVGLAVVTSVVIIAAYFVQSSESRELKRKLKATTPRVLSEQQIKNGQIRL